MSDFLENVVIGGGLAGSMVATRLATTGCEVVLFEKRREPHHKVCGEFLSAEAVEYLQQIEIDPRDFGAHPIQLLRLHSGAKSVETPLPFVALSLSRFTLDEALLERAESAGCRVQRGVFVEKLSRQTDGFTIDLRGGETIHAKHVFLATGKHDLPEQPRGGGSHHDLVGFKMHWQLTERVMDSVRHTMELFLFHQGYGGITLIERAAANLCFVVRQRRLRELGGWPELLKAIREEVPAMDSILQGAVQCWPKPLAISPIPYGYLARSSDGIWRVGDQAAVIPSFTGDGMSIALHSGHLAAEMYLRGRTPDEHLARLSGQLRPAMRFATNLSRAMVTGAGRTFAPFCLSLAPGLMSWIAEQTRIPARALNATRIANQRSAATAS